MTSRNEPIAIVGSGCRFPGDAKTPSTLWNLLSKPRDLTAAIPSDRFNTTAFFHKEKTHHGSSNVRNAYTLTDDVRQFDAQFFNIKPVEAEAIDPQHRMLLETVYEALESAGQSIEKLQGSSTSVYVGVMNADYNDLVNRDLDSFPQYAATGTARSILSNRISYFFDWHGPSMSIDTACSSSLVALHEAVRSLRTGEAPMAVAAGANLILGPEFFVSTTNLGMLSPDGKSKMWDESANGYARGDGFAAVILKTLSQAVADGDHIECIVRETGVNQDGKTPGITMPSAAAQAKLIKDTYAKAGLDPRKKEDRCQYFEAHGTGTQAGDPQEASAVSSAFFERGFKRAQGEQPLYIGSIKTVIGHTEGTAGLAGVLKASLAMKHGIIPPNMHLTRLSGKVKPYYDNLRIPTSSIPWPELPQGIPRRASVNSFGFGGTNAHAILESYDSSIMSSSTDVSVFMPFVFSAQSERSLTATLRAYASYLRANPKVNLRDFAWTLATRRSVFPMKVALSASSLEELVSEIEKKLESADGKDPLATRSSGKSARILGVFTGQGAQWPQMGRQLILQSKLAAKVIDELEISLQELPESDRPEWSIKDELLKDKASSRLAKAEFSQPLCTAVQVMLVEHLRAAGVSFESVVGHSSGEIAAAYTAGFISARDAIRIAYYRGFHAKLAGGANGEKGAMMAAGMSLDGATEFCNLPDFEGRISPAASNSSSSVTLSGDMDAIKAAKANLDEAKTFARQLQVDTAYHSHHMIPCSEPYIQSLRECGVQVRQPPANACTWFSSVHKGQAMTPVDDLKDLYWRDNMVNTVLFSQAIETAIAESAPFDLGLEVGPHPALKGPATQTITEAKGSAIPYFGVLGRGTHDVKTFSAALGSIWTNLGGIINFASFDHAASGGVKSLLLKGLPTYVWDHDRRYWAESRKSKVIRERREPVHHLLGRHSQESTGEELRWTNVLKPKELPWLPGHQLQGQIIFPAAGYIAMALEASLLWSKDKDIELIEILDFSIDRSIPFNDENTGIEVLFTFSVHQSTAKESVTATFKCFTALNKDSTGLALISSGKVQLTLGQPDESILPPKSAPATNMVEVNVERFYENLSEFGYEYNGLFKGLTEIQRKLGIASGLLSDPEFESSPMFLVHPATLDIAIQTAMAAYSFPGDGRFWSLHVPTHIERIAVNPLVCRSRSRKGSSLRFNTFADDIESTGVIGDIQLYPQYGTFAMIEVEGLKMIPLTPANPANDRPMYKQNVWASASPDGEVAVRELPWISSDRALSYKWLAYMVGQIAHRYPHMKILQVGANSEMTIEVLKTLGSSFNSYTFANDGSNLLEDTRKMFPETSKKLFSKDVDISTAASGEDTNVQPFDLVIAPELLGRITSLQDSLRNLRNHLRSGGYLLLAETMNNLPTKVNGPTDSALSPAQWNRLLKSCGYSGVDTITNSNDVSPTSLSAFSSKATDDNFKMLIDPLRKFHVEPEIQELVIIGGKTLTTAKLIEDLEYILEQRSRNITLIDAIEDLDSNSIPAMSTVLSLAELDEPIFSNLTPERYAGLQTLFQTVKNVVWVTQGSRADSPYSSMTVGLARSLVLEIPHLRLQFVDVDPREKVKTTVLAAAVLRLQIFTSWEKSGEHSDVLWTAEPELSIVDGRTLIPRLIYDKARNDRYNAFKREIKKQLTPSEAVITAHRMGDTFTLNQQVDSFIRLDTVKDGAVTIKVSRSAASAIKVTAGCYLFPVIGVSPENGKQHLALSAMNSSVVQVPKSWTTEIKISAKFEDQFLFLVHNNLLAQAITASMAENATLLVHHASPPVASALKKQAAEKNFQVVFTTLDAKAQDSSKIFIHPHASNRAIQAAVPGNVFMFLNLAHGAKDEIGSRIANYLAPTCVVEDSKALFRVDALVPANSASLDVAVSQAVGQASSVEHDTISNDGSRSIALNDLPNIKSPLHSDIIDWTTCHRVSVEVEPVDSRNLFRANKTYLLVGLTGDLGLSLCEWMVTHGARHIVITSRKPSVDTRWLTEVQKSGAVVRIMPVDVTDKDDLLRLYNEITTTLPPIAGVANGAMVLRDTSFFDLRHDAFTAVLKPKVEGTINLNELFSADKPLDFFILFSSGVAIVGNPGQTAYGAANMFMATLAAQRRNQGLAASVIHIGAVLSVGYVARELSPEIQKQMKRQLGAWISERDVHQFFAEAVISGHPQSRDNADIVTALTVDDPHDWSKIVWNKNPRLASIVHPVDDGKEKSGDKAAISVQAQLKAANTEEDAFEILKAAFCSRLQDVLQLEGEASDPARMADMAADELGVDSLIAVEVRSWFIDELSVDFPVLKILGGTTIGGLLEEAVKKLPESLFKPGSAPTEDESAAEAPKIQAKPTVTTAKAPAVPLTKLKVPGLNPAPGPTPKESFSTELKRKGIESLGKMVVEAEGSSMAPASSRSSSISSDDSRRPSESGFAGGIFTPAAGAVSAATSAEDLTLTGKEEKEVTSLPLNNECTVPKSEIERSVAMSYGQSRFWFLKHFLEDPTTFNVTMNVSVKGALRVGDLARAVQVVGQRHEALRTCFYTDEQQKPVQGILKSATLRLEDKKVSSTEEVHSEFEALRKHVYDIENGHTMRVVLLSQSDEKHNLLVGYHHINMDGMSSQVFLADLEKAYHHYPLPEQLLQYPDFTERQRKDVKDGKFEDELRYWRSEFPDFPSPLPLFQLSKMSSRRPLHNYDFTRIDFELDSKFNSQLKAAARKCKSSSFHFILATLKTTLFRFLDTDDLCIGIADANRIDTDTMNSMGMYLNVLPLRFRLQKGQQFDESVREAKTKAQGAFLNSKLPFDVLLEELGVPRSSAHSPLFQVFVDYRIGQSVNSKFSDCDIRWEEFSFGRTAYDLVVDIVEDTAGDAKYYFKVQKGLYSQGDGEILAKSFRSLLEAFVRDTTTCVETPPLFAEEDIDKALELGKGRSMQPEWPSTIPERVDQMVARYASKTAVKDGVGNSFTYAEMASRINNIASSLIKNGAEGRRVAVFQEPTADWICSLLAIWRVGGVYIPLDLRNPIERLAKIVQSAEPTVLLAHENTVQTAPELGSSTASIINISSLDFSTSIEVVNQATSDLPAAILYTSGSTGTPKGILLKHSSLCNEIEGYSSEWRIGQEVVLQQSAYSFDFSLDQILTSVTNGGTLYVVPKSKRGDSIEVTKIMATEGITYTKATPSEYFSWLRYGSDNLRENCGWKFAFGGGETWTNDLKQEFRRLAKPGLSLFNSWGPAEITISATKIRIPYSDESDTENPPVGLPLPNYSVFIVDEDLKPVPVGVTGEVVVGGAGPAFGYVDNDDLTNKKFINNQYAPREYLERGWKRAYLTGDRGRLRADGALMFDGRIDGDTQIKLRGLRIELEDIESSIIKASEGVLVGAVVSVRGDPQFLVAHVEFGVKQKLTEEQQSTYLRKLLTNLPLPQYMCPAMLIPLDSIPANAHAKIDRLAIKSLPLPQASKTTKSNTELTSTEAQLKDAWTSIVTQELMEMFTVDSTTDFFQVGGNSMLLVRLQAQIRESFSVVIPLIHLLENRTLGAMATKIESTTPSANKSWDEITSLSGLNVPASDLAIRLHPTSGKTILLTGSSGHLGRGILNALNDDESVTRIHCIGVRSIMPPPSHKVIVHKGDLTSPRLGLSESAFATLSSSVDTIIHSAAKRSFFEPFEQLRPINVETTRELIAMAAPCRIPIHFISSDAVRGLSKRQPGREDSVSSIQPPNDGSQGYLTSKWASEMLLESAARELGIRVVIHRPAGSSAPPKSTVSAHPSSPLTSPSPISQRNSDANASLTRTSILASMAKHSTLASVLPSSSTWIGTLSFLPVSSISSRIIASDTVIPSSPASVNVSVHRLTHDASTTLTVAEITEYLAKNIETPETCDEIDPLKWMGRIKKVGFGWLIAGQDLSRCEGGVELNAAR